MRRAVLVLTLLLTSCAPITKGDAPDPHRFGELVPGVSTTSDAIAKLGKPTPFSDVGHGRILLQWMDLQPPNPIHLAITFRADDRRMIEVQHLYMP